ncbi:MAG: NAD(P)H-dependent glycerol-3-phosphate dehydrogenase [bacterium]
MSGFPVIAVIGAGAWGTAFAVHLAFIGQSPKIWAFEEETAADINSGENTTFLPGVQLSEKICAYKDIDRVVSGADIVFMAVPTQHLASVLDRIDSKKVGVETIFVDLAKGIERKTGRFPSQIIRGYFPNNRILVLSGPSFASEVAEGKPTVLVTAGDRDTAKHLQDVISGPTMRVYRSDDILGVELGGALKNVFALASGMIDGLGLGENTQSAMIVRGLAEVRKLALAMGADNNTIFGISGLGDLVLTCTSEQSRNYRMGKMIAEGNSPSKILDSVSWVAEGIFTASAALQLAEEYDVEMPITQMVQRVIDEDISPEDAVAELMNRPYKEEFVQ